MIDPTLQQPALRAIHFLTTSARFLAYDNEPNQRIAKILDDTEYLLTMLFVDEDRTDAFIETLARAAEEHQCRHAYDLFAPHLVPQRQ
jgi:hypothetical protein